MYIKRALESQIEKFLFKGKILIIYGARQVGKTTMVKSMLDKYVGQESYFNCEIIHVKQALEQQDPVALKNFLGSGRLIVLDEAQKVANIGLSLKLLIDTYPDMQIIATGSSSFDLSSKVNEPLTGRALEFKLYPISLLELEQIYHQRYELPAMVERILVYGSYPSVILADRQNTQTYLTNLSSQYLYKDVLSFENLKRPELLMNLLQMFALQIGSEVSIHELAVSLQCSRDTVARYLDLLEKSFVIFHLRAFSRNLRKEISKKHKIYFYDLGVRNALIDRFSSLAVRDDVGALWENFCVLERIKSNQQKGIYCNIYFWRNHAGREVDYLEERDGQITAFEFKWGSGKYRQPEDFLKAYGVSEVKVVNRDNLLEFIF